VRICKTNSLGKVNGIYKSYHYSNGQLWKEVNYIDGIENGIFKSYHSNGQLSYELNYIDGKKV
jgi:antitoxin component YwqK of YwqJK toxin-antitoxin module